MDILGFLNFFWIFSDFLDFFKGFLRFLDILDDLNFFGFFFTFCIIFKITYVTTKVTIEHQSWPKVYNEVFFCPKGQKKPRPKPSAGARSRHA